MADRIGGFKTDAMREDYEAVYERIRTRHWPVPHEDIDLETAYGTTRVRRSDGGDGTPLLMIHPTTGSSLGWYPIVGPLTELATSTRPTRSGPAACRPSGHPSPRSATS